MEQRNHKYTFQDVIYAARHHRNFDYGFWLDILIHVISGHVMTYFGYILVCCALLIITGLGTSAIFLILPSLAPFGSFTHIANTMAGLFVLFNIYFNYIQAMRTDPGTPDHLVYSLDNDLTHQVHTSRQYRQCKKCNLVKPPRAHHCSMCERCTLRMDHHCPWINNCVGLHNYRYFVSFLFWTSLGTLYLTLLTGPGVLDAAKLQLSSILSPSSSPGAHLRHHYHSYAGEPALRGYQPAFDRTHFDITVPPQDVLSLSSAATAAHNSARLVTPSHLSASSSGTLYNEPKHSSSNSGHQPILNDMGNRAHTASTIPRMEMPAPSAGSVRRTAENIETNRNTGGWWRFFQFFRMISSTNINSPRSSEEKYVYGYPGAEEHVRRKLPGRASRVDLQGDKHSLQGNAFTHTLEPSNEIYGGPSRYESGSTSSSSSNKGNDEETDNLPSIWIMIIRPHLLRSVIDDFPKRHLYLLITFAVAVGVHVGVVMLFFFHSYLVLTGQTTLEFYMNSGKRSPTSSTGDTTLENRPTSTPYDRGMKANFEEVFGPFPWYIALLPSTRSVHDISAVHNRSGRKRADTAYGSLLDV